MNDVMGTIQATAEAIAQRQGCTIERARLHIRMMMLIQACAKSKYRVRPVAPDTRAS